MTDATGTRSLALDAGQTGIKVRVTEADGASTEQTFPGVRTDVPLLPQLAEVARAALGGPGVPVSSIAAGVSGLTSAEDDPEAWRVLLGDLAPERVLLAHDSVSSFLGTLGDARGAVVASGTGVVTLAVGRSHVARVDGWGYIMGDAGSGYWIGREALDAVMRAYDGRGPATALTAVVQERWPALEDAYVQLQSDPARVSVVASFARAVAELADADAVAEAICRAAAAELAHSVATGLRRVADAGAPEVPLVSAIGGVFRSALIRRAFEELLRAELGEVRFEAPHGTGLDGAAALAGLGVDHPLLSLVSESRG
ncbi:N-acetylglucosamine kinase [Protaetiibacter larvae]|uniref:ATPase BadF/BadG/BcrA/BcrD type domain-containing protein n=1 Tax=Protaetiibacter larvae TaxID=2592654 RepID=A0A5C1Y685_9MICO|nr:BadF/BadG/BcrA/BcrD ATPase family protein [Protaetiibacter larvae]QEO08928.1 hypothetical protein FLP23_02165 [Protaetiibacter larvae]